MEKEKKQATEKKENSETFKFIMSDSFEEDVTENNDKLNTYEQIMNSRSAGYKNWLKLILLASPLIVIAYMIIESYLGYGCIDWKEIISNTGNIFLFCLCIFWELFVFLSGFYNLEKYNGKIQLIRRLIYKKRRQQSKPTEKKEKDFFDKIIEDTNDNLNVYYQQALNNAKKILVVAITFGVIGFLFILISLIIGAITGKNINLVYLSTVTGIIIDSFAGTFFIQYGKSIKNMQFYFEGLLKTQDKILDLKAKNDIIDNSIKEM